MSDVGALPNAVVIGAMKCGTTAMHRYLDAHPDIGMAAQKEVNFFFDPPGAWDRGVEWYSSLFDPALPVRGECSPGYTSPDHPEAAARMAEVLPHARLVCLVRDPVERAASQYLHHRREGAERRPIEEALVDPASQYLSRGRYFERLEPYLRRFDAGQLLVVVQERLLRDRAAQLERVYAHVGADPAWWTDELFQRWHTRASGGDLDAVVPARTRRQLAERVSDDVERLRRLLDDDLPEWTL